MPNNWQRLVRLTDSEENEFIKMNRKIIDDEKVLIRSQVLRFVYGKSIFEPDYIKIYKEEFGEDVFYRIVFCGEENPNYLSKDCQFSQILVFRNKVLASSLYNYRFEQEGSISPRDILAPALYSTYQSIDVIGTKNKAAGILLTNVYAKIDSNYNFIDLRKGQFYGINKSYFFNLTDFDAALRVLWTTDIYYTRFPENFMGITSSDVLLDPNIPLKYTLQNAFDNNPATSFVENSDDDLMNIYFYKERERLFATRSFAIINGYAQNNTLYYNNNHIKEIGYYSSDIERIHDIENWRFKKHMSDDYIGKFSLVSLREQMSYTIVKVLNGDPFLAWSEGFEMPTSNLFLVITDIYKGNKYNDTCIAEINIKTENGWLFGDIGE
jgi:hypothetical protein